MFRKLLFALGLRHAPAPVRSYVAVSSLFGGLPAIAFLAWKYRGKILPVLKRATHRGLPAQTQSQAV
jgi:hypothetical protein